MRSAVHAAYTIAVLFVSLWPRRFVDAYVADPVQRQDRWIHVACFLGLAALSLWAHGHRHAPAISRWTVLAACAALGVVLELLQETFPGIQRQGSLKDVLENVAGSLLGLGWPVRFWMRGRSVRRGEPAT